MSRRVDRDASARRPPGVRGAWKRDIRTALGTALALGVVGVLMTVLLGMHGIDEVCDLKYDGTGLIPVPDREFDKGCDPKLGMWLFATAFYGLTYFFLPIFVLLHGGRWLVHGVRRLAAWRRGGAG